MGAPRSERVAGLLRRELAQILQHHFEYDIPRGLIAVTDVEVAGDLSHAKVYVSVLESDQSDDIIAFLNDHAGAVRHELGKRVRLRIIPTIRFFVDRSSATGQRIEQLLAAAKKKK
ncbi:MAG TPA: 30S ribosome-binding factor RbfA [Wenzhouxiangella sp.]|nr:30S ribosome-binding factor RbfA [Wenzhouxiangella sp.]HLS04690.1 30S ribosome-binding factor RbfA [Wenzhouxiangella sp.]